MRIKNDDTKGQGRSDSIDGGVPKKMTAMYHHRVPLGIEEWYHT
jgi:hypothetical protein